MSNLSNTGITRWSGVVTDLCHEVMGGGNYYFAILAAKQPENLAEEPTEKLGSGVRFDKISHFGTGNGGRRP